MEALTSAGCPPKRHRRCCHHSGRRLPVRRRVRRHPASHRASPPAHPCHQMHRRPKNRRPGSRPSNLASRRLRHRHPSNLASCHPGNRHPSNLASRRPGNRRPSNLASRHLGNRRPSNLANRHLMRRRRKAWTASRASTTRKHRRHHHRMTHRKNRTIDRRWSHHPSCHRTACWNCCRRWNRKSLKNPRSRTNQMTPTNRRRACSVTTACWRKKTVLRSRPSGKRRRCRWQSPALQSRAGGRLQGFCSSHSPEGNQELSDARAGPSPRPGLACDGRAERALSFNMCRFTVPPGSAWARRQGHRLHRSGKIEADRPGDRRPCSARER